MQYSLFTVYSPSLCKLNYLCIFILHSQTPFIEKTQSLIGSDIRSGIDWVYLREFFILSTVEF